MPIRNWLFIAAIGCLSVGPVLAEHPGLPDSGQAEQKAAVDNAQSQTGNQSTPKPNVVVEVAEPTDVPEPIHDTTRSEEPDEDQRGFWWDTGAQWFMAATGIFAVAVSFWAVVLLKRTLTATETAVREAENATKAANAAVDVTREIGQAQVRAYVHGLSAVITDADFGALWVTVTLKNTGQSPARNLWASGKCSMIIGFEEIWSAAILDESLTIGAGLTYEQTIKIPEWNVRQFGDKVELIYYVKLGFWDVFGERQTGVFVFNIGPGEVLEPREMRVSPGLTQATP